MEKGGLSPPLRLSQLERVPSFLLGGDEALPLGLPGRVGAAEERQLVLEALQVFADVVERDRLVGRSPVLEDLDVSAAPVLVNAKVTGNRVLLDLDVALLEDVAPAKVVKRLV